MSAEAHAVQHHPLSIPRTAGAEIASEATDIDEWAVVEARVVCANVAEQLVDAGASLAHLSATGGLDAVTLQSLVEATEAIDHAHRAITDALHGPTVHAA